MREYHYAHVNDENIVDMIVSGEEKIEDPAYIELADHDITVFGKKYLEAEKSYTSLKSSSARSSAEPVSVTYQTSRSAAHLNTNGSRSGNRSITLPLGTDFYVNCNVLGYGMGVQWISEKITVTLNY